ncbi:MAG TPA: molybdopterin-binding protein [Polyangiaceae bacterium]|nr:molybdopterin-binding protein [Polyangiaceae bacterium]
MSNVAHSAAFLAIGNELLSGKVVEANLAPLAKTLRGLGIELRCAEVLLDDVPTLAAAIARLAASYDLVVTSGGVGPTHDDVTIEAVARAFGRGVVRDPELMALVQKTFGDRTSSAHLRFADVPSGAVLRPAPEGAVLRPAPDTSWPTPVVENVWILPGVPEVFRMKLSTLRSWVKGPQPFVTRALVLNRDEVDLKEALDVIVAAHPAVTIGSYPALFNPRYRTRVTFDSTSEAAVVAALEDLSRAVSAWIVEVE